jgi:RHS repeat-associated protein
VIKNYTYGYDLAGNRTLEQIDAGVTTSVHNNLNQLTGQTPGGSMEFSGTVSEPSTVTLAGNPATVDGANNWRGNATVAPGANAIPLVATDVSGNATTKTINVVVSGGTARTLSFDLAGNETNNGAGQTYTYDALNRLKTITQGANVTEFVYNGLGQRVQEKFNGTLTKQWVWDGGAQPAEERDPSGNVTKRFFGGGEQIGGINYYFATDHLGSIREMTDSSGTIRARYEYDPYGRQTKVSGDLEADFGFTGFYRHQSSGLNLTWFRAYDNELGRWTTRDPIEEHGGLNLYGYVGNNPISYIDPNGLALTSLDTPAGLEVMAALGLLTTAAYITVGKPLPSLPPFTSCPTKPHREIFPAIPQVVTPETIDVIPQPKPDERFAPPKVDVPIIIHTGPCFAAGTLVATTEGDKKIEDVRVGDTVYAHDFESGKTVERKVTATLRNHTHYWVDVRIGQETITATRGHLFWVENEQCWVKAVDLKEGMQVCLLNGRLESVSEIVVRQLTEPETTYNFEVEDVHDYFVGYTQVLVHNGDGSYTNTHDSGKVYVGKGDADRAAQSGKRITDRYNDPLVHTDWTPANGTADSFAQEANRMRQEGGPGGNTYNEINSPGEKILQENECP